MIDYAKTDKIIEYSSKNFFPFHNAYSLPSSKSLFTKLIDVGKIFLNYSPVHTVYGKKYAYWKNPFFDTRRWEYPWVYEQLLSLYKNAKIIDCGCGVSKFPVWLVNQGFTMSGLDFFVENPDRIPGYGITKSHRKKYKKKVNYFNGSMFDIPIENNSYDAVICISVIEHIVKREDAKYHLKVLLEMKRILKPDGLLICTYDTILNPKVFFANIADWGPDGWFYLNDIKYLSDNGMVLKDSNCRLITPTDIMMDESTFFIPPQLYFPLRYGHGFELFGQYHRLTSVGFVMVKKCAK